MAIMAGTRRERVAKSRLLKTARFCREWGLLYHEAVIKRVYDLSPGRYIAIERRCGQIGQTPLRMYEYREATCKILSRQLEYI